MRKFMILAAAVVALVVPTAALAVVNVDATTGTGVVGKGDVQLALGGNNAAFDAYAPSVKFSVKKDSVFHQVYRCNGVDYINDITNKAVQPIHADQIKSANGKQITGWNLTGPEGALTSSVTTYSNSGAFGQALRACNFSAAAVENLSEPMTSTSSLYVNDVPLPNTPVAPIV